MIINPLVATTALINPVSFIWLSTFCGVSNGPFHEITLMYVIHSQILKTRWIIEATMNPVLELRYKCSFKTRNESISVASRIMNNNIIGRLVPKIII
jgi:hypothetical protein